MFVIENKIFFNKHLKNLKTKVKINFCTCILCSYVKENFLLHHKHFTHRPYDKIRNIRTLYKIFLDKKKIL